MSSVAGAEAPRGSSYAHDPAAPTEALPTQTLVGEQPASAADLRVKQIPAKLKMRRAVKSVAKADTGGSAADTPAAAGDDSGGSVGYKMFPTTVRDLRERVTFRIRAGVDLETAPASGDTLRGGFPLSDGFTETRPFIVGDAVVGARGIVTPSLNGYFLGSFILDASDSLAANTAVINPADGNDQFLAIKAGYAEWGRDDRKPDDQQPHKVWLRGGRQFRLDGGNLFAYFDGLTVGYKESKWNASAFLGQRVALYTGTEPGILFGATAAATPNKNIKIALDYMGLAINSNDFDNDGEIDGETRHLVAVNGNFRISKKLKADVNARLTGLADLEGTDAGDIPATKFALGRVGGRLRYEADRMILMVDAEQRFADDVAYDLAAATSTDILDIADKIGVGMTTPVDTTRLGAHVDWQNSSKKVELLAFARADFANQKPEDVDQKSFIEGGVGIAGTPVGVRGSGVYTTAQYTYRQYTDEGKDGDMRLDGACNDFTDNDGDGFPDNCQDFGNSASSGVDRMHQIAAEAVLATRGNEGRRWRFSAGGFFRVYDFRTPYREVTNDARGGGRVDLAWWFSRDYHLDITGEVAQSSPTLSRDLGVMSALRAVLEARW
ncbi:MAG: hypothetical protein ABI867_03535 [Kofleriaceae bacterium]